MPASRPATQATTAPVYATWPFDAKEAARRQDETAKALGISKETALDLGHGVTIKFVLIPAGKFVMGSSLIEQESVKSLAEKAGLKGLDLTDEGPQHEVTISKPFYFASCHVTKRQFAAFVDDSGYKTDAETAGNAVAWQGGRWAETKGVSWQRAGFNQTDERPVVCISHNDAVAFCRWLGKKHGKQVTLPSEAQFEYSCRAGTTTAYCWGDDPAKGEGWCNIADKAFSAEFHTVPLNGWNDGYPFTSPVGTFKANAFGLHDMCGNTWQWCSDWYEKAYYAMSPPLDPQGSATKQYRVLRGGSWFTAFWFSRSASRERFVPSSRGTDTGFRVVITDIDRK